MRRRVIRGVVVVALAAGLLAGVGGADAADAKTMRRKPCVSRLLVLGAFPAELDKLLMEAELDPSQEVVVDDRRFYVGTLRGNHVALALSGIGLVNAEQTAEAAFDHFRCRRRTAIRGVVFSGVAGGDFIGDVAIPTRWTEDGETFLPVDPAMLATARRVAESGTVKLDKDVPLGDPACTCQDPGLLRPVSLPHQPKINVGGDGISADSFGGRTLPCFPAGGDVFGCEPCRFQSGDASDAQTFATKVLPFVDPGFFSGYFEKPPVADPAYEAQDMETAAVARVAARHRTPFIGFRAASDGGGDPLMLPGFPFQFFVYKHLAADNAAMVTLAFLEAWAARR
jgi:nucleoside phosphorylase